MKKFLSLVILFMISITIVSCMKQPVNNKYYSDSDYETAIIDNADVAIKSTITIIEEIYSDDKYQYDQMIGSAVVYKKERSLGENKYFAVTAASLFNDGIKNIRLLVHPTISKASIFEYAINVKYGIAFIGFRTRANIEPVDLLKDMLANEVKVGQTVLTASTGTTLENFNTFSTGKVTKDNLEYNDNKNYMFIHDASLNIAQIGSGLFNLEGGLIGINVRKDYYETTDEGDINIQGVNFALRSNLFSAASSKMTSQDFVDMIIPDEYFEKNLLRDKTYVATKYESAAVDIIEKNSNSVVTLIQNDVIASGLIYKKANSKYYILTKKFETTESLVMLYQDSEYGINKIIEVDEYVSILELKSTDSLEVYSSSAINQAKGVDIVKGQSLIGIGSLKVKDNIIKNLSLQATVSKNDYLDGTLFMHDGKFNVGQEGAPIFNFKGELIGINVGKVNEIATAYENIVAEGLGFAYDINHLASKIAIETKINAEALPLQVYEKYQSEIDYEKKTIDVIKSVDDKVVTVQTSSGHGSGVIYKKEKVDDNTYRYYVLTNYHVIQSIENIKITFKDGRKGVFIDDYQFTANYDMAVLRFTSADNLEVVNSKIIDTGAESEYTIGQTVIAIGAPENMNKNNYVTKGVLANNIKSYNLVSGLAVPHDAAINPGNSGGPLFNLKGELIGINVSKLTWTTTKEGQVFTERLGTALNLSALANKMLSYRNDRYIESSRRYLLGVTIMTTTDFVKTNFSDIDKLARANDGIVIVGVDKDRNAYEKVRIYDLIIGVLVNGEVVPVKETSDLSNVIKEGKKGDKHTLEILRKEANGEVKRLLVEIELS